MTTMTGAAQEWSAVAGAWDANVDEVDARAAEATAALLDRAAIAPGDRVLELAAGPGTLGTALSRLSGPRGSVVLSDIAPGMVEVAARRNEGVANLAVEVLDLSAIESPNASFDVVVCRMGLMLAPDPAVALGEIRRILAPGGRLTASTWAGPENNPWMTCVGMAAMMNGLVTGAPPVGPGGIFSLGDPERLSTLANSAGFLDATVEEFTIVFGAESIDAHITRVASLAGPLAGVLKTASSEQRAALRRSAAELAAPYITKEGVQIPGRALLLSARA